MLRIFVSKSGSRAKEYFKDELKRGDYYTQGQQIAGLWGGKLARGFGLEGEVTQKDFDALIDNTHPSTGERLTKYSNDNRRVGFDFTFNAPKSFSVLYERTQDEDLIRYYREAVSETMIEIEKEVETRVRKNGADTERTTGNIAYAEFLHHTARPVDGVPDPHLHTHMFVMNITNDGIEEQYKAIELGKVKADSPYYEAMFHSKLTKKLTNAGYGIESRGRFWELAGIERDTVMKYSSRTSEIESLAEQFGITNKKMKSRLAALSRKQKNGDLTLAELREQWELRLTAEERTAFDNVKNHATKYVTAAKAVDLALKHHLERQSVVKETRLIEEALRSGFGVLEVSDIKKEIDLRLSEDKLLKRDIEGIQHITTLNVLKEERQIIGFTQNGYGQYEKLNQNHQIKRIYLSDEQCGAVDHVVNSRDRVIAVQGKPGVGKTTIMLEAIEAIEAGGTKVFSFAPSTDATENLRSDGITTAQTTAMLINSVEKQKEIKGSVIWIDEAGLLSVRETRNLMRIAHHQNARIVLAGDIKQHNAVIRGDAYRVLQKHAGLKPYLLSTIRRQKGQYRDAVDQIAKGNVTRGYNMLNEMNAIIEIEDSNDRNNMLAKEFVELGKKESVLAISPTHKEGEKLTEAIRNEMKEKKLLKGITRQFKTIESKKLTEAEREQYQNYNPGEVIKYNRKSKTTDGTKIENGQQFIVEKVTAEQITIVDESKKQHRLDLATAKKFDVCEIGEIEYQKGDSLRITANARTLDKRHKLNNGSIYNIKSLTPENNIELENGWIVDSTKGNFKYGYVVTSQSSQSKGMDHVLIAQSTESMGASSKEQFNVSTSRGKKSVRYYTDDREEFLEMVKKSTERISAVDLMGDEQTNPRKVFESVVDNARAYDEMMQRQENPTEKNVRYEPEIRRNVSNG